MRYELTATPFFNKLTVVTDPGTIGCVILHVKSSFMYPVLLIVMLSVPIVTRFDKVKLVCVVSKLRLTNQFVVPENG